MEKWQVGVFLSSLKISDPVLAVRKAKELGLLAIQLPPLPPALLTPEAKANMLQAIADAGLKVSAGCAGFEGEDYADMDRVTLTVGYRNPATLEERLKATREHASLAQEAGARILTTHVGVVPEDRKDPAWKRLVEAAQRAADDCGEKGLLFGLETGQETPEIMLNYMADVNRKNLKVNFDPANMILYGTGDPLPALRALKDCVAHVHCKDGLYPSAQGQLGTEVRLGDGQVGMERYLKELKDIGYQGPLIIEREAGDQRIQDIQHARDLLGEIKGKLGVK